MPAGGARTVTRVFHVANTFLGRLHERMMMTDPNPYSSPTTVTSDIPIWEASSTKRLWLSYGIAPLVAPLLAAITVFVVGFSYQAAHPEDIDLNPMSVFAVPIVLLLLGVPASYGVAGLIGMPIAFWLRRRGRLNGFTVHAAALLWAAVLGAALTVVGVFVPEGDGSHSYLAILGVGLGAFAMLAPFILLSATTFWLIGVRSRKRLA